MLLMSALLAGAENGYELWLRYRPVADAAMARQYGNATSAICINFSNPTADAIRNELELALGQMLGKAPRFVDSADKATLVIAAGNGKGEGYRITSDKNKCRIEGDSPVGALYGAFAYLRLMQQHKSIVGLTLADAPKIAYRMLNHWDNLNGSIERGYAGYSLWNWERLPHDIDPRLIDYARANASAGINGVVVNNVNAKAVSLKHDWLVRLSGLADAWRPYGIRVYLTAKYSAPIEIGGLKTANPTDPAVKEWWRKKADEIYSIIPDFGGFLVKANSEGQPGPQDYGCSHAQGANLLADALKPHGGIVFWRAFVYHNDRTHDRVSSSYNEFRPLDYQFADNVVLQVKNGPIDFQPREPFHPLFGSMKSTSVGMEFQITQENLGHAGHLVYLGKLYSEVLQSDTDGKGTTVADHLTTSRLPAIAGVPNIGSEINWTGHPFGQANWYAFGRLSWNPDADPAEIADEWIRLTLTLDDKAVDTIKSMMLLSREAVVNYEMPLGLNHIMNYATHNGPEPWHDDPVWTAFDYHKITSDSIGVDRTTSGTGATAQYSDAICRKFNSLSTCPDEYLLWFHRLPWDYTMRSGKTLWQEIVDKYYLGVNQVETMAREWDKVKPHIDRERHQRVARLLQLQLAEAKWWRDGCLLFFDSYAKKGIPADYEQPEHSLDYYKSIPFPYNWNGYYK